MLKKELLLSIIIPAYNAEKFLSISLPSVLNERLFERGLMDNYEIIIINDGSQDNTYKDALVYANRWNTKMKNKNFIKVIDKENHQYGSVINMGIRIAQGHYVKVLDVDDHFKVTEFIDFLYVIKGLPKDIDVIITDFIYEKVGTNKTYKWSFANKFYNCREINLEKTSFPNEIITMHSLIYRRKMLIDNNYTQIEDVYYSDSQYAVIPFHFAKKYYYANLCVYGYYIGRDDQSINIKVMVKNSDHQLAVVKRIIKDVNLDIVENKIIKKYIINVIRKMILWRFLLISSNKKVKNKSEEMRNIIKYIKEVQPKYYSTITNDFVLKIVILTRGHGISTLTKAGLIIYNKFRNNIFADSK